MVTEGGVSWPRAWGPAGPPDRPGNPSPRGSAGRDRRWQRRQSCAEPAMPRGPLALLCPCLVVCWEARGTDSENKNRCPWPERHVHNEWWFECSIRAACIPGSWWKRVLHVATAVSSGRRWWRWHRCGELWRGGTCRSPTSTRSWPSPTLPWDAHAAATPPAACRRRRVLAAAPRRGMAREMIVRHSSATMTQSS